MNNYSILRITIYLLKNGAKSLAGLPYATAHELLQKLEKMDLVQKIKKRELESLLEKVLSLVSKSDREKYYRQRRRPRRTGCRVA